MGDLDPNVEMTEFFKSYIKTQFLKHAFQFLASVSSLLECRFLHDQLLVRHECLILDEHSWDFGVVRN